MNIKIFTKSIAIFFVIASVFGNGVFLHQQVFAATTITVNSTADSSANDGVCTLREAITAANSDTASGAAAGECAAGSGAGDTINFSITGAGPHTIQPTSALPTITQPAIINGCSEPNAVANTAVAPNPFNGTIAVELDGQLAGAGVDGLTITAGSSTIRCLAINRFTQDGINISSAGSNTIAGNYIGTSADGTTSQGNGRAGIFMTNTPNNSVGGTLAADRNLIAASGDDGILISGESSDDNLIAGNYLGLGASGTSNLGNISTGVTIQDGPDSTVIGGTVSGSSNVSSGNGDQGIAVNSFGGSSTTNTSILGNYIGTNYLGTAAIANEEGIGIQTNALNTTIGGTTEASRNIISGNTGDGIHINDTGSTGTVIRGNYVGTNASGTAALANGFVGVHTLAPATVIGGTASGAGNVISGNTGNGVTLDTGSTGSTVQGNYIGTSASGLADVGNDSAGIGALSDGAIIGGTASGARNVISGNGAAAIVLSNNSTVQGNYIGVDATGNSVLSNVTTTNGTVTVNGGDNNVIGGSTAAARNVIAGGDSIFGVIILGGSPFGGSSAINNKVQGNYIGTDASGSVRSGFGFSRAGVMAIFDAQDNLIGGTGSGEGNLIAGNGGGAAVGNLSGGFNAINNSFLGNSIHSNSGGSLTTLGIDLLGTTADFTTWSNVGVTANDAGDSDVLSNHLMNFPVISSVTSSNGQATITYSLDINGSETGATGYRVEFFANDSADPSGNGEGQTYIGADTVSGDVTNRSATITLPSGVSGTKFITAVTTMMDSSVDGFGHSSEFSANTQATLVAASSSSSGSSSSSSASDGLADTGDNSLAALYLALMLIASGVGVVFVLRQQKLLV